MIEHSAETTPVATVGIFLWPGMTLQDVVGPQQALGYAVGLRVYTFARTAEPVVTDTRMTVVPDYGFDGCPQPDVLLVGGGGNPVPEMSSREIMAALVEHVRGMVNRELIEFVRTRPSRPVVNPR